MRDTDAHDRLPLCRTPPVVIVAVSYVEACPAVEPVTPVEPALHRSAMRASEKAQNMLGGAER